MNTTNAMLLVGLITSVGRWAQDKPLTARIFIGVFILALFLTVLGQGQPKLASRIGTLVLVAAVFGYGPPILTKLGYPVSYGGSAASKAAR